MPRRLQLLYCARVRTVKYVSKQLNVLIENYFFFYILSFSRIDWSSLTVNYLLYNSYRHVHNHTIVIPQLAYLKVRLKQQWAVIANALQRSLSHSQQSSFHIWEGSKQRWDRPGSGRSRRAVNAP